MLFDIFHTKFDYFKCILCFTNPIHSWRFYYICVLIKVVWGMDKVPIYLYCWHVLKAWCLCGTEKIKYVEVWGGIFQDLSSWCDVHVHQSWRKKLTISKNMGGLMRGKTFINISMVVRGQITYRLITINLVSDNIYHGLVFKILL